jgi:hypothetical protein
VEGGLFHSPAGRRALAVHHPWGAAMRGHFLKFMDQFHAVSPVGELLLCNLTAVRVPVAEAV